MATDLEYALMAGASYISTRPDINKLPVPGGWAEFVDLRKIDPNTGFEATHFSKGTEIVISFAGTYNDPDISDAIEAFTNPDLQADAALAVGDMHEQLLQAAEYYLQVKAQNQNATITLTGHSLGGGLAALIGVFFGVEANTFDQAPFADSARAPDTLYGPDVAVELHTYLTGRRDANGDRLYGDAALVGLTTFIQQREANGGIPNSNLVTNIIVQGEVLTATWPINTYDTIGAPAVVIDHYMGAESGTDLHSQALLTAFLQSEESDLGNNQALHDVTYKLTDLLPMIFDENLYARDTDKGDPNFLEQLVRHEAGNVPDGNGGTIAADAMVTRFTRDLWKIAQEGGLTLTNQNISRALTAFAMQMYYENPEAFALNKQLFADVTGGIRFDLTDVAATLTDAKGWQLYLKDQEGFGLSWPEQQIFFSRLLDAVDWFVQAGSRNLVAEAGSNNAFMLGASGDDIVNLGDGADELQVLDTAPGRVVTGNIFVTMAGDDTQLAIAA